MADPRQITQWIEGLAAADTRARAEAGLRVYLEGVNQFLPLLHAWVDDLEFREMTLPLSRLAEEQGKNGPSTVVVGVAVPPELFETIWTANGSPHRADVPPDQDALEFELEMDDAVKLDVLTSREPAGEGAIARYLKKFGVGIQQVELYVRDVDRATGLLREKFGLAAIYPATRAGADGTRVNFFLATTPDSKKLLVELVEAQR
ncbi:MAG TPA: hypothetical protein VGD60_13510 [Candidatus Acidoferrales bacterium]